MPFGLLDTTAVDFPANVDQRYLAALRTEADLQFTDVLREVDQRLVAFNRTQDPLVAELVYPVTDPTNRSGNVTAFKVTERGEFTMARPQRTRAGAHMHPIRGYDVAVGFTEDALQRMAMPDILDNIDSMLLGFRENHRRQTLYRLFSPAEVQVDDNTSVTSPAFAGSGTGANAFTGAYPNGQPLENGFSMYYAADTTGGVAALEAALDAAVTRLKRVHGEGAILDFLPSDSMLALLMSSTRFTKVDSPLIRTGSGTDRAVLDPSRYVGAYGESVRVRHALLDMSSRHGALFMASTPGSAQNILAWRYNQVNGRPDNGRGAYLRYRDFFPLSNAAMLQDFGIGVRKRLGAALVYAANGASAYVAPTWTY